MLGHSQYHGMIRKYVILFGSLFNEIYIHRRLNNGQLTKKILVPLEYGPKEKWLVRTLADPTLRKPVEVVVPRMGFELTNIAYDPTRAFQNTLKNAKPSPNNNGELLTQYVPVPFNFDVVLSVFTKNADDGTQIIEQILPYFRPEFSLTIDPIVEMGLKTDIPVVFNGINMNDLYDGDFQTRRSLTWDLSFTIKGWLYGPVSTTGIIQKAQIDAILVPGSTPIVPDDIGAYGRQDRVTLQPGLTADGQPTTDVDLSIPYDQVAITDPFGFATDIVLYTDGKKYDPETGTDK